MKGYGLSINDATKIVNFNFDGYDYQLKHGSIVIASIANYTNTSNPSVLLAAGIFILWFNFISLQLVSCLMMY